MNASYSVTIYLGSGVKGKKLNDALEFLTKKKTFRSVSEFARHALLSVVDHEMKIMQARENSDGEIPAGV